jgi:putative membrane protein
MIWYGGDGWGWGGLIVNVLAMVVLWGAVITAIGLAIHFLSRDRSDPWAPRDTGSTRAEDVLAERVARGEMDNDELYCRVM